MGILEMLLTNSKAIEDGFKQVMGIKTYRIVRDKQGDIIGVSYELIMAEPLLKNILRAKK
ncbi:hypothetical protein PV797_16245 [Clostridiaceae bacterium M8S5]|nr:hypothetical protein PV797_16245 [Clostridiaceae bacterium M8S5]